MSEAEGLRHWLKGQIEGSYPAPITVLVEQVLARHGEAVAALLLYGSCLRSGDPFDGLVDLYVIVDDYTKAYSKVWLALANRLLPPNVFYLEAQSQGLTLRAKYAVLSRRDFACGMGWFQAYLWGRFAQPCRLLYRRDPEIAEWVAACLLEAMRTFVRRAAPMCPKCFKLEELWQRGLELSYSSELRAERAASRAEELVRWAYPFYQVVSLPLLRELPGSLEVEGERVCLTLPRWVRFRSSLAWRVRILQGKVFSLLRLIKAGFTFQGGVPYVIFKLERHTGKKIELPERVHRHPLLYGWSWLWRLYRQGMFR
jgi:hypothetical protein